MVHKGVVLVCLLLAGLQSLRAVPLPMFVPFGPDYGDRELEQGNDVSASVALTQSIPFLGTSRTSITVQTDGVLELSASGSSAFIYAFSADVDTTSIGHVFYRESTEVNVLNRVNELSNLGFQNSTNINYAFVATWFYVGYHDSHDDLTNTFQCVVGTDGERSFVLLLYADGLIQWMTGDSDGGVGGFGGDRADVGFVGEDPSSSFFLPVSNTSAVLELDTLTNIGFGGVWTFEVGTGTVQRPVVDECAEGLSNCDPNAQCTDLVMGFECECLPGYTGDGMFCFEQSDGLDSSGSGSGSGSGSDSGMCQSQFEGCCVPSDSNDCVLSVGLMNCSCSQQCFQQGDCCEDILSAECFPAIAVGFSVNTTSVSESEGVVNLIVDIAGFFPDPLQIQPNFTSYFVFYTRDLTAEAPADYEGTVQVVEFSSAGEVQVPVEIVEDQLLEGTEYFTGLITAGDSFVTVLTADISVAINDNDMVTVGLEQIDYTVAEDAGLVEVCVTLINGSLGRELTIGLSTQDGSAVSSIDYVSLNTTLTLSGSVSRACVNISIVMDGNSESDESFSIIISSMDSAIDLRPSMADVTIQDSGSVTISLEQSVYSVKETDGSLEVCATVTRGQLASFVSVQFATVDGTAEAGSDYTDVNSAEFFSPTETRQCVDISITADALVESDESFTLELTTSSPDITVNVSVATITIVDMDTVTVSLEQSAYTVSEAAGFLEVCANVTDGQLATFVSVQIVTMDDIAEADSDYTAVNVGEFFSATATRQCVNIVITADTLVEFDESFTLQLTTTSEDVVLDISMATITILDDDAVTVSLEQSTYTVSEAAGSLEVCANVTDGQLAIFVSVQFTSTDGSAEAGSDYTAVNSAEFFSPTVTRQCVNIDITADTLVESDESFTLQLTTTSEDVILGSISMATVTIIDSDTVTVSLEQSTYTVSEAAGFLEVCANVTMGELATGVTVEAMVSTVDGTAMGSSDYITLTGASCSLSYVQPRCCVNITLLSDSLVEREEGFSVQLNSTDTNIMLGITTASVTLINSDTLTVSLEQSAYTVSEDAGSLEVCANVTDGALDTGIFVSVQFSTMDGSAEAGSDYTTVTVGEFFSATETRQCVNVDITADAVVEPDESFILELTTTSEDVVFDISMATITIRDLDAVVISLDQSMYSVNETDGSLEVCANITNGQLESNVSVSVQFATMDGTAEAGSDYTAVNSSEVFSSNVTRQCVDISITADALVESDESFTLQLTTTSEDVVFDISMATITILDDDAVTVSLEQSAYTVSEAAGFLEVCASVTDGQLATYVSVQFTSTDGSAEAGSDYTTVNSAEVFSPTETRQCVNISITADALVESDESFTLQLTTTSEDIVFDISMANITILDDDAVTVSLEQSAYTVPEAAGFLEVCASVTDGQLATYVSVQLTSTDGSAEAGSDYTTVNSAEVFSPTETRQCVNISIIADALVESDESFTLQLTTTSEDIVFDISMANITILDDDAVTVFLEQSTYTVSEAAGSLEVCASVTDGQLATYVSVQLTSMDGSAEAGSDYTAVNSAEFFSPTETRQCVNISIIADALVESDESFTLQLTTTSEDVILGSISMAIVTIIDSDTVTVSLEQSAYTVSEAAGFLEVCAVTSGQLARTVLAQLATMDGSAEAGFDYTALINSQLTFDASTSRSCAMINISQDQLLEDTEFFSVILSSNDTTVVLGVSNATVSIIDSNALVISLEQSVYSVNETDGSLEVCATVTNGQLASFLSLQFATMDGTAGAGSDYTAVNSAEFFSPTETRQCVNINIIADALVESDESFTLQLTTTSEDVVLDISMATITILDDDVAFVEFEQLAYSVGESEGSVEVCVFINLLPEPGLTIIASYVTVDGSASAGEDYSDKIGEFKFVSNSDLRQCQLIDIIDDSAFEGNETFQVNLTQAGQSPQIAVVTIVDNDPLMTNISLEQGVYSVGEGDGVIMVCLIVSGQELPQTTAVNLFTMDGSATGGLDYQSLMTVVTFFPGGDRRACVSITIFNDAQQEGTEQFTIGLSSGDFPGSLGGPATVLILNSVVVGFSASSFSVLEGEPGVPHNITVCLNVSTTAFSGNFTLTTQQGTANDSVDYIGGSRTVTFGSGGPTQQCAMYMVLGDDIPESTENFTVLVSSTAQGVFLAPSSATAVIVDDDDTNIVIIDGTPQVDLDPITNMASVTVNFTLTSGAVSAMCQLIDAVVTPIDCTSRTVTFAGLDPNRQQPFTFVVTEFNAQGVALANITRQVRLGFNMDCSVVFVNAGEEDVVIAIDDTGFVRIEWSEVGPVESTDCRLEVNGVRGNYLPCTSPHNLGSLAPANYAFKVRPFGATCSRRIRRTVSFTIQ